jgi:hypothetical protein
MVDKAGLQVIGWIFGSATAVVVLVAALLVGQAIASPDAIVEAGQAGALMIAAADIRWIYRPSAEV